MGEGFTLYLVVPATIMLHVQCRCLGSVIHLDPGSFAGYYAELLPERCWDSTGRKVVSEENWGSAKVVMCTDVDHKKVTKITSATDKPGTWSVLDVSDNVIVAGYSSPTSAPQLVRRC